MKPISNGRKAVLQPVSLRHARMLGPGLASLSAAALVAGGVSSTALAQGTENRRLDTLQVEAEREAAGANPYANPQAPYKVERASSSKHTRDLIDTPKSITVVPKEMLDDTGASSMREVMRAQPGITLGTGEGGNAYGDRFIIRGFEARNDVYVDGLRDPGVTSRATFAVEQIEISRGPSSSFAGRGTSGGAVNSVSKMPGDRDFTELTAGIGAPGYLRSTVDLNKLLGADWTLRVNAEAYKENIAGRTEVFDKRNGLAAALKYQPSERLAVTFDHYHLRTDSMPDWGIPWNSTTDAPYEVSRDNFYGLTARDFWTTGADISTIKLEYELSPKARLISQTRYGRTRNRYVNGIPSCGRGTDTCATLGQVSSRTQARDQLNEYTGHSTNAVFDLNTGSIRHSLVTGFEITRERFTNRRPVVTDASGLTPMLDLVSPNPNQPWDGSITPGANVNLNLIETASVWLMDTAKLNARWEVFGGLRWDSYKIYGATLDSDYVPSQENRLSDTFVNWHAGATRAIGANGKLYASISTSSNPPGEQVDAGSAAYGGLDSTVTDLKPERNRSIELGTKWNLFNDRLALTGAVFQTVKSNAIVAGSRGAPSTQLGEIQVRGVEMGMAGSWRKLSVHAGLSLLDTEITASSNAADIGGRLPNTAERSAYLQTRYQLNPKLSLGGAIIYTGPVYGGTPNQAANDNKLVAWTRLDLNGEYRFDKQLSVRANIVNATDKRYFDGLYRSGAPFVYVAPGRSAFLTLVYRTN